MHVVCLQVCMVYFHAVDFVLGRKEVVRRAWQARCHLPKIMFASKRPRKGCRTSSKLQNYCLFKRMIAVKTVVMEKHKEMLRLYEKYCREASTSSYWGADEQDDNDEIAAADETNEADCDDGF